jgi:uncharacterized protein
VSEFRINISNLPQGVHEYSFEAEAAKLNLDSSYVGTVRVGAKLDKSNGQIMLRAAVNASAWLTCDRCLEHFDEKIGTRYGILYVIESRTMQEVQSDEEVQILSHDTNYIDLDEDARQFLELSLPQKQLCREDCAGLCPICGKNKNREQCSCTVEVIDPRWDALKKLTGSRN